jgi:hypothetical protein
VHCKAAVDSELYCGHGESIVTALEDLYKNMRK